MNLTLPILPTQENKESRWMEWIDKSSCSSSICNWYTRWMPYKVKHKEFRNAFSFTKRFEKKCLSDFDNNIVFCRPLRSRMVLYILDGAKVTDRSWEHGIEYMMQYKYFNAAYPLHEGPTLSRKSFDQIPANARQELQKEWASYSSIFRRQPIDKVNGYFGQKVAYYYAFVGFYLSYVFPLAVLGCFGFLFGVASNFWSEPLREICKPVDESKYFMCPLCDRLCSYHLLKDTCIYARVTHCFDNDFSIIFSICMLVWAALFLKFWKREEIKLSYKWDSIKISRHATRPQYAANAKSTRQNPVTGKEEPRNAKKAQGLALSGNSVVVLFFISLVIGAVIGVVVYRAAIYAVLIATTDGDLRSQAKIVVTASAAFVNLIAINLLEYLYTRLAVKLTDWENPRTLLAYENSFTVKMFWFQFVNTYSSVFYMAFFKGEIFAGWPGHYRRFGKDSKYRIEGCSEQGCFLELCVQVMVLMVGQQLLGNLTQLLLP